MKPVLALTVLLAFAGGVLGWLAMAGESIEVPPSSARPSAVGAAPEVLAVATPAAADEGLRARVVALEAEVAELRRIVRSVRRGERAGAATVAGAVTRPPVRVAGHDGDAPVPEALEAKVESLVADGIQKHREERWARREARMVARLEERLETFVEAAGLSRSQTKLVGQLLRDEQGRMLDYMREARTNGSWPEVREKADRLREQTDIEMAEVLEGDQLDAYGVAREGGLGGPPRRFRGRR